MPQPKETPHSASQDPISGSVFHQNMKIWSNSNTSENILILSALRFEKTEGRNTLSSAEMCCFKVRVFWICFHFRETFLGHFNIELFFLNLSYFSKKKRTTKSDDSWFLSWILKLVGLSLLKKKISGTVANRMCFSRDLHSIKSLGNSSRLPSSGRKWTCKGLK